MGVVIFVVVFVFLIVRAVLKRKSIKKKKSAPQQIVFDYGLSEMKEKIAKEDKEIELLNKAYDDYKNGGSIDSCIAVYETILLDGVSWNAFNFYARLAKLYEKADMRDKAWGILNYMDIDTVKRNNLADHERVKKMQKDFLAREKRIKK